MSSEKAVNIPDLSKLQIPGGGVIDIRPKDESWLASKERTFDEANKYLSEQLSVIQSQILAPEPNSFNESYGERTLGEARLLAYI